MPPTPVIVAIQDVLLPIVRYDDASWPRHKVWSPTGRWRRRRRLASFVVLRRHMRHRRRFGRANRRSRRTSILVLETFTCQDDKTHNDPGSSHARVADHETRFRDTRNGAPCNGAKAFPLGIANEPRPPIWTDRLCRPGESVPRGCELLVGSSVDNPLAAFLSRSTVSSLVCASSNCWRNASRLSFDAPYQTATAVFKLSWFVPPMRASHRDR